MISEKQYIEAHLAELRGAIAEQYFRVGYCDQQIVDGLNELLTLLRSKLAPTHLEASGLPAPLAAPAERNNRLEWREAMHFHDCLLASVLALAEMDLSPGAGGNESTPTPGILPPPEHPSRLPMEV